MELFPGCPHLGRMYCFTVTAGNQALCLLLSAVPSFTGSSGLEVKTDAPSGIHNRISFHLQGLNITYSAVQGLMSVNSCLSNF